MKKSKVNDSVATKLESVAKEFNFNELRAIQGDKEANSGQAMFKDFQRMNFVINEKKIDSNFIRAFYEGVEPRKSKLFSYNDVYNDEISGEGTREIDTDYGKVFVAAIIKDLEKELVKNAFDELWKNHCEDIETADHQKTEFYRKELEEFYNAGQKHRDEYTNKNYRFFAKEVFKKIFEYAEAEVPNDSILEELVTNCNQTGYEAPMQMQTQLSLGNSFMVKVNDKVMNIDCVNQNEVRIRSDMNLSILPLKESGGLFDDADKIGDLSSSLEFILEPQEDSVKYRNGNLLMIIPKELEHYKNEDNDKSLFEIIKEYFQKFCQRLGFQFKKETDISSKLSTQEVGEDRNSGKSEITHLIVENIPNDRSL